MYASYIERIDALTIKTKNTFFMKDSELVEQLLKLKLLTTVNQEEADRRLKHIEFVVGKFTTEKAYVKFLKRHLSHYVVFVEKCFVDDLISKLKRPISKETVDEFSAIYQELTKTHDKAFKQIDVDIKDSKTIEDLVIVNNTIALVFEEYIKTASKLFCNLLIRQGNIDEKR